MFRRTLQVAALAAMLAHARLAFAGQFNFYWNDCMGSVAEDGSEIATPMNVRFNCTASTAIKAAVGSFILWVPMTDFASIEVVIELQAEAETLPPWWDFDPDPGACHDASLFMTFDFSILSNSACIDPFGRPAMGGLASYTPFRNRARITGVAAIDPRFPGSLAAGVWYYGFRLALKTDKASDPGSCEGCATPVALLLTYLKAAGVAAGSWQDCSEWATNGCITWNSPGCYVATKNRTWGQVKGLYR